MRALLILVHGTLMVGMAWGDLPYKPVDEALQEAKRDGRPILAIMGNDTNCGACRALSENIKSDPKAQQMLGNFVAVKVDTSDEGQAGDWLGKYPMKGNGIPYLLVLRASGEEMYAKSGRPENLQSFLLEQLRTAGVMLPEKELKRIAKAVEEATQLRKEGNPAAAVDKLARYLGTNCFAEAPQSAEELAAEMEADARKAMAEAVKELESGDSLKGALGITRVAAQYGKLPSLTKEIKVALNKYRRDRELKDVFRQADMLIQAETTIPKSKDRAITAYQRVLTFFPDTQAAEIATKSLKELGGSTEVAARTPGSRRDAIDDEPTELSARDRTKAESNLRMAETYAKNNRSDKVREYAEKVIDAAPGSDLAEKAQSLLDGLDGN